LNPRRKGLLKKIGNNIELIPIEDLRDMAYAETGIPKPLDFTDTLVGMTKYFDGTVLDNIYQVKP
jgi:citrate lyase subunit alpha/citrate CoA-transferase